MGYQDLFLVPLPGSIAIFVESLGIIIILSLYMKNLKDTKTKIFPSKTRGGKELPSSSALDSPSTLSKLATPPHAINSNMLQVIDDATSAMNDTYDDASTLLTKTVPLGEFLEEQLAGAKENEITELMKLLKLRKFLKLNTFKHLLDLALLDMNCMVYLRVMLWMER